MSIRVEVGGCVVRLFTTVQEATKEATVRESARNEPHVVVEVRLGFLVRNQVTGTYVDVDGTFSKAALELLLSEDCG